MYIFSAIINRKIALFYLLQDGLETHYCFCRICCRHQSLFSEHGNMGNRALDIKTGHKQVELAVSAHRKLFYLSRSGCFFFTPEFHDFRDVRVMLSS